MKKIFTLGFALLCTAAAFAQDDINPKGSIIFVDADGVEVPDGSVITRSGLEIDPDGFNPPMVDSGLYAKKTIDDKRLGGRMIVSISKMDSGSLQYCFGMSCQTTSSTGTAPATSIGSLASDYLENTLATEWIPASETAYGECTAKLTLHAAYNMQEDATELPDWENLGESSSITVHFKNVDPTGINDATADANATVVARYAADGKQIKAEQKGINILRLSNGKTVKVVK